jgi:hypothetical protein
MCHLVLFFFEFGMRKATEKIGYKNFLPFSSYFGIMPQCLFIITESKDRLFLYMRWNVFPTVRSPTLGFLVFSFHGTSELQKQQMAQLLSMNHHRALCMAWWTIHGTIFCYRLPVRKTNGLLKSPTCIGTKRAWTHLLFYSLPVLYKLFQLLLKC